jgi:hypothetical protein
MGEDINKLKKSIQHIKKIITKEIKQPKRKEPIQKPKLP